MEANREFARDNNIEISSLLSQAKDSSGSRELAANLLNQAIALAKEYQDPQLLDLVKAHLASGFMKVVELDAKSLRKE